MIEDNKEVSSSDIQELGYHLSGDKEKYFKRFEKIEAGERTFNFCAGFFSNLWLAYQFLFPEWIIISFIGLAIKFGLTLWALYTDTDYVRSVVTVRVITYGYWLLKFILIGNWGDRLLFRSIKKRVKNNRNGKCSFLTMITASNKTIVFRGFSVFVCAVCMLLSEEILLAVIDWIVY